MGRGVPEVWSSHAGEGREGREGPRFRDPAGFLPRPRRAEDIVRCCVIPQESTMLRYLARYRGAVDPRLGLASHSTVTRQLGINRQGPWAEAIVPG